MATRAAQTILAGSMWAWAQPAQARKAEEPQVDPCAGEALHGFVFEIGNATGGSEADALEVARANARKLLYERLCSGTAAYGSLRCDAVRRQIDPWKGVSFKIRRNEYGACATAAIPTDYLDQLERDAVQLDADVDALAAVVADKLDGRTLAMAPPLWATGCSAGDVGASLSTALRSALGETGSVRILPKATRPADDDRILRVSLAVTASGLVVAPALATPGERGELALSGFSFPTDLMEVSDTDLGLCAGDSLLGTERGLRVGASDLLVEVDVPTDAGVICPGEVVAPTVRVNQPARVQVFGVGADGEAHLLWPGPGADDLVEDSQSLGSFDAVYQLGAGEERLVALAIPRDHDWGLTKDWGAWCRVPGDFRTELYPQGAAVGASTFTILAPGEARCADGPTQQQVHSPAPRCGD